MKFPFEATTRDGEKVTITGYYTGYKDPWCGFLTRIIGGKTFDLPVNWSTDGTYAKSEAGYDLIDLPKQT